VVIDYNRFPVVKGAGSAFFFHVSNGRPTAGCVAMVSGDLNTVMGWLDPSRHPVISIGVGAQATALITRTNQAAAHRNPFGHLDTVTAIGHGQIRVTGWGADPDNVSARLGVHVYADGHGVGAYATGVTRPDVQRIMHTGPAQGFNITAPLARGTHSVCVFLINISTGTTNPVLGCRSVTVT
jgi:hypothetical protein